MMQSQLNLLISNMFIVGSFLAVGALAKYSMIFLAFIWFISSLISWNSEMRQQRQMNFIINNTKWKKK